MKIFFLAFALFYILMATPAQASGPDYLTLGSGAFDFDKRGSDRKSFDYRAEYEWGASLLPLLSTDLETDTGVQLHPAVGLEATSHNAVFANAGLDLDIPFLWRHGIFTWSEAAGYFNRGHDPQALGSPLEFRSQVELGWRFATDVRLTGYLSHISNAHLSSVNPGAEIVGAYLHLPLWWDK